MTHGSSRIYDPIIENPNKSGTVKNIKNIENTSQK